MKYSIGSQVTGTYCNVKIEGTITENRLNYRSYKSHITVKLNHPLVIYGTEREYVTFDSVDEKTGCDLATDSANYLD